MAGSYSISIGDNASASPDFAIAIGGNANAIHSIALGTNTQANGMYSNALGFIAHALGQSSIALGSKSIATNDYSCVIGASGYSSSTDLIKGSLVVLGVPNASFLRPAIHYQMLAGVSSTGTPSVLTADGLAAGTTNMPALAVNSVGIITGRVTGLDTSGFAGDTATFILTPLLVTNSASTYRLVNSAVFTLEHSTAGASSWSVPTLAIDGNGRIAITVSNSSTNVNWMAHLQIQASA